MTCQLYRHFDSDGVLLYVGISLCAVTRLACHKESPWFTDIATVTIENHVTVSAARKAEREAIRTERPRFNVAGMDSEPYEFENLELAIEHAGGLAKLANALHVTPQVVSMWRKRKSVPPRHCAAIEKITGGELTREQLRPDIFSPA